MRLELAALFLLAMVLVSCNESPKIPESSNYSVEATCEVEECGIIVLLLGNDTKTSVVFDHEPGIMPIGMHEIWSGPLPSPFEGPDKYHLTLELDCSSCLLTLTFITPSGDKNCLEKIAPLNDGIFLLDRGLVSCQ